MEMMMDEADLPESWSHEFVRKRRVRINYRRGDGFPVQPKFEPADGRIVSVHCPRIMDPASEGGHSLYAGTVCWDVVQDYNQPYTGDEPLYLAEGDFEWL